MTKRVVYANGRVVKPPFDVERAKRSMVRVWDHDGPVAMGVLLEDFVVTACHCLPRGRDGQVLLPHPDLQGSSSALVKVSDLRRKTVAAALIAAADPCSDIAVLHHSTYSGTDLPSDAWTALDRMRDAASPAITDLDEPFSMEPRRVWVMSLSGGWGCGTLTGVAYMATDDRSRFRGGMSGSPVFDDRGRVVGLASIGETQGCRGIVTLLKRSLPGWVAERFRGAAFGRS